MNELASTTPRPSIDTHEDEPPGADQSIVVVSSDPATGMTVYELSGKVAGRLSAQVVQTGHLEHDDFQLEIETSGIRSQGGGLVVNRVDYAIDVVWAIDPDTLRRWLTYDVVTGGLAVPTGGLAVGRIKEGAVDWHTRARVATAALTDACERVLRLHVTPSTVATARRVAAVRCIAELEAEHRQALADLDKRLAVLAAERTEEVAEFHAEHARMTALSRVGAVDLDNPTVEG